MGSAGKAFRDRKKNLKEEKNLADESLEKNVNLTSKIITGRYSKREFDINNCGGKILNLKWKNARITKDGIAIVKKHLSRFEEIPANIKMIKRLEEIEANKIKITDYDKRFYTHEIREFERFKKLGHENTHITKLPKNLYDDAHSATLEDFKIYELNEQRQSILYHTEINQEIDFLNEFERNILNIK